MEGKRKSLFVLLTMMFIINHLMLANGTQKGDPEETPSSFVGKWHPKMFYVVLPGISLSFILPYEPDQSGVHNLFFISKESGETLLLDTIKDNQRYFTPFSSGSCYDVVLLYNNGKYVRYYDMIFENCAEVDMRNFCIQPYDSVSEHWKTMRTFDYAIIDRASDNDDMAVSDFIIKGYVFSESGSTISLGTSLVRSSGTGVKEKKCTADGYFEIDIEDDTEQTLEVIATLHNGLEKNNIIASCGLILVIKVFGKARKIPQMEFEKTKKTKKNFTIKSYKDK